VRSAAHLQALAGSRTWDKELVMWVGSEKDLYQALGAAKFITLDLLDLFDPENLPADDEATGQQLRDQLPRRLKSIPRGPGDRVVLVVKSIGLLACYNVGLKAFYDWFIGDFAMVVLLLDGGIETMDWPEEVRCEGNRILGYFSEPGMVKEVFSTGG
jgi:hypothetical protein